MPTRKTIGAIALKVIHPPLKVDRFKLFVNFKLVNCGPQYMHTHIDCLIMYL